MSDVQIEKAVIDIGAYLGVIGFGDDAHSVGTGKEKTKASFKDIGACFAVLLIISTFLGFNAAYVTDTLHEMVEQSGLTTTFVGIVLLPLLSVEFTVLSQAWKNKMDRFVTLTVGKCLQTALLVIPSVVLLGWAMGKDAMSLDFDPFEVIALFASVMYITSMIQVGRSN